MIVVIHEALQWSENHCNETKAKYETLKGYDTIMDLVDAYRAGAEFIQNELAKVKARLREKALENAAETDCTEPNLICVQNADVFAAYDEAIKLIDEIIKL